MTIQQIKIAIAAGQTVHWANDGYTVLKDKIGQYLIGWDIYGSNPNYVGLSSEYHRHGSFDNKASNPRFYIAT